MDLNLNVLNEVLPGTLFVTGIFIGLGRSYWKKIESHG